MEHTAAVDSVVVTLVIGVMVAAIHSAFQVSASVLTLLSGHTFGAKRAHQRVLSLNLCYIFGAIAVIASTLLGITSIIYALGGPSRSLWIFAISLAAIVGCITSLAYYRNSKGTALWLPRPVASYLLERAKKTKSAIEATVLGGLTVIAELPFAIAPLLIAGLFIASQPLGTGLTWALLYSILATLPLVIMTALLGAGHRLSSIQRWRERNKVFLQYSSGIGLLVVSLFIIMFYLTGGAA